MYLSILIKKECVTHTIYQTFSSKMFEKHLAPRFRSDQIIYICNIIFTYPKDIAYHAVASYHERPQVYI